MTKINIVEIVGTVLGIAGLGAVAVSAPIAYYANKFHAENYQKAGQSDGVRYKSFEALQNSTKTYESYEKCLLTQEILISLRQEKYGCSVEEKENQAARELFRQQQPELVKFNSTQDKLFKLYVHSQTYIALGLLVGLMGGMVLLTGRQLRKDQEEKEAEKAEELQERNLKSCSLDEKLYETLYCTNMEKPHLEAARTDKYYSDMIISHKEPN